MRTSHRGNGNSGFILLRTILAICIILVTVVLLLQLDAFAIRTSGSMYRKITADITARNTAAAECIDEEF